MNTVNVDQFYNGHDVDLAEAVRLSIEAGADKIIGSDGANYILSNDIEIRDRQKLTLDFTGSSIIITEGAQLNTPVGKSKINILDSSDISLIGFDIDGSEILSQTIGLFNCTDCAIKNNIIRNSGDTGAIIRSSGGVSNEFIGNHIFDGNSTARALRLGNYFEDFIEYDLTVTDNRIHDIGATGIVLSANGFTASGNEVFGTGGSGIIFGGDRGFISENGQIYGNTVYGNAFSGIQSDVVNDFPENYPRSIRIYNNIIYDNNSSGIYLFHGEEIGIFSNTISGNRVNGITIGRVSNAEIIGNYIVASEVGEGFYPRSGVRLEAHNDQILVSENIVVGYRDSGLRVQSLEKPSGVIEFSDNFVTSLEGQAVKIVDLLPGDATEISVVSNQIPDRADEVRLDADNIIYSPASSFAPILVAGAELADFAPASGQTLFEVSSGVNELLFPSSLELSKALEFKVFSGVVGATVIVSFAAASGLEYFAFRLWSGKSLVVFEGSEQSPISWVLLSDEGTFGVSGAARNVVIVDASEAHLEFSSGQSEVILSGEARQVTLMESLGEVSTLRLETIDSQSKVAFMRDGPHTIVRTSEGLELTVGLRDLRDVLDTVTTNGTSVFSDGEGSEVNILLDQDMTVDEMPLRNLATSTIGTAGQDVFAGFEAGSTVEAGDGLDLVVLRADLAFSVVSLQAGFGKSADSKRTFFLDVEDVVGSQLDDHIIGSPTVSNLIEGGDGNDILLGLGGHDRIAGGGGSDVLYGGTGRDVLAPGEGADVLYGGTSADWVDYSSSSLAVSIDLIDGIQVNTASQDTLFGVENVVGSSFDDVVIASADHNTVYAGSGDDTVFATGGGDLLFGGGGDDVLHGSGGQDSFYGGAGNDSLFGGAGFDWIFFEASNTGVYVDLANELAVSDSSTDFVSDVEFVVGSRFADEIVGSDGVNIIRSGLGNDTLVGGRGNDVLDGGAGDDQFVFHVGDGRDRLHGFDPQHDTLVIRELAGPAADVVASGADVVVSFSGTEIVLVGAALELALIEVGYE